MQDQIKNWAELNKKAMIRMQALSEINSDMFSSLLRQQVSAVETATEDGMKNVGKFGEIKKMEELVSTQSEIVQKLNAQTLSNVRSTMDILNAGRTRLVAWVESGVKEAAELNPMLKKVA